MELSASTAFVSFVNTTELLLPCRSSKLVQLIQISYAQIYTGQVLNLPQTPLTVLSIQAVERP